MPSPPSGRISLRAHSWQRQHEPPSNAARFLRKHQHSFRWNCRRSLLLPTYRHCFVLRFHMGLDLETCSEVLGLSRNEVNAAPSEPLCDWSIAAGDQFVALICCWHELYTGARCNGVTTWPGCRPDNLFQHVETRGKEQ